MSLVLPTTGIDSGLTWEESVNTNSGILDGHNHSVGSGVQINPSGININTDLPFNGFNAISERSTRFNAQTSPISLPADIGCIYVSGVDLYYNDVDGNQIRITSGGTVNATSSGISSGSATASFSSSVLVIDSASNTPANIKCASILMGNTGVSGSDYLTLSPPSALSSNYSIVLPPLPAQTNVMTLDTSGNMNSITYDQVGSNMTSVGANAIRTKGTRTLGTGVGQIAVSGSSGTFTATATSPQAVTNLSFTMSLSGRPVQLILQPDLTANTAGGIETDANGLIYINNLTTGAGFLYPFTGSNISSISVLDYTTIGQSSCQYQVYAYLLSNPGSFFVNVSYMVLTAYEIF